MSKANPLRRFSAGEMVRLTQDHHDNSLNQRVPAGTAGQIGRLLDHGICEVRMFEGLANGLTVVAKEADLVEADLPVRREPLEEGELVQGIVERVAPRAGGSIFMLALTLVGRHETFVIYNQNGGDEEFAMLLTRHGDKVRFRIKDADDLRPRAKSFENLHVH